MSSKRLILTYNQSCNLSCDFCYVSFHHQKRVDNSSLIIEKAKQVGFDVITFGGGDPFYQKYFRKACLLAKHNGLITHVDTNCIAIKKDDINLIINKIDLLGISLDAIGNAYDSFRKCPNLFKKVDAILDILNSLNYKVKINTVITQQNKDFIFDIYKYISQLDNVGIWSLYQFFPIDASKKNKNNYAIDEIEFERITDCFQSNNFKIEILKYKNRVNGYVFVDESGRLYTNTIDGTYQDIGNILNDNIKRKLDTVFEKYINPVIEYRYIKK